MPPEKALAACEVAVTTLGSQDWSAMAWAGAKGVERGLSVSARQAKKGANDCEGPKSAW